MSQYVSVRSNWTSNNCQTLDLICDVGFEEMDENEEQIFKSQKSTSDETVTSVTLRFESTDEREDPQIVLKLVRPDENQFDSIQILSSSRNIEFYHREYLGTSQGFRIAEIESESIYETNFQFDRAFSEITLKCLKLANPSELIIYCLQINLIKRKDEMPSNHLPFDLNRVRSMIDETNLSSNARQLMSDLQQIENRRRTTEISSTQFDVGKLMLMMRGMTTASSTMPKQMLPPHLAPMLKQLPTSTIDKNDVSRSNDNLSVQSDLNSLENRLQHHLDARFKQLQEHFDARLDRLENRLDQIEKNLQQSEN